MWQDRLFAIYAVQHMYISERCTRVYISDLKEKKSAKKREFVPFTNTWNCVASQPRGRECATTVQGTLEFSILYRGIAWLMRRYGFRRRCLMPHAVVLRMRHESVWKDTEYPRDRFAYRTRCFVKYRAWTPQLKMKTKTAESVKYKICYYIKNFKIICFF